MLEIGDLFEERGQVFKVVDIEEYLLVCARLREDGTFDRHNHRYVDSERIKKITDGVQSRMVVSYRTSTPDRDEYTDIDSIRGIN